MYSICMHYGKFLGACVYIYINVPIGEGRERPQRVAMHAETSNKEQLSMLTPHLNCILQPTVVELLQTCGPKGREQYH